MTPHEHYVEAERLISLSQDRDHISRWPALLARAQIHATLATAQQGSHDLLDECPNEECGCHTIVEARRAIAEARE